MKGFVKSAKTRFSQLTAWRALKSALCVAVFLCAGGAWGRTESISGSLTTYRAYVTNNLTEEYVLNLSSDTTIEDLVIGPNVIINLNGYALTITTLDIGSNSGLENFAGKLTVNGGGSLSVTTVNDVNVDTISIVDVDSVSSNLTSYTSTTYTPELEYDTNVYYWTGAGGNTSWQNSANWKYKAKTTDAYVSVAEYDGGSHSDYYPGYENVTHDYQGDSVLGDVAVFDAGKGATNITLKDSGYTLNIISTITGDGAYESTRASITGCGENAESAIINSKGTWLLANCKFGTLNAKGGTVRTWGSGVNGNGMQVENLTIAMDGTLYGSGSSVYVSGDFTNEGTVNGNLTFTVAGTALNGGSISVGTGKFIYNGTCTNNGTISAGAGTVSFNGGYSGAGSLSVSTGSISFEGTASNTVENLTMTDTGSVTFSGSGTNTISNLLVTGAASITNNASTAVNLGSVDCGSADVTFTGDFTETGSFTASSASTKFKNGNVSFENGTFDASGGTVYFYNTTTDGTEYSFTSGTSPMTFATLSFGGNTNFVLNADVEVATLQTGDVESVLTDDFTVSVTASSAHTLSVMGTGNALELSRGSGTGITNEKTGTLSVGENVTLTVSNMAYLHSGTVIQNAGTLHLKNAENVTTTGVSNPKITNSGTFTVDNAGIIAVAEIENTGTISTGSATISVQKIESTGTISLGAGSLSVTGSDSSSISEITLGSTTESGGTVSNTGSGLLAITALVAGDAEATPSEKVKSASISNGLSGTISVESAIFYATTVAIANLNSSAESLSFNYFSAEDLGGSTVNFSGRVDFVDSADDTQAKLVLSGTDADSLLSIASPSTGVIYLPRAMAYGNYLSVSQKVTVGGTKPSSYWNGSPQPENSYTTYNSEYAETGVTAIYGWRFTTEYYWSGRTSTAWNLKGNWLVYSLVSTGYGRNKTYSYQAKTATKVPDSASIVYINSTYPTGTQGSGSTQTVTHFPELSASVKVAEAHVGEEAELDFNAKAFESTGGFFNDGDVYLNGGDFTVGGEFENTSTGTVHLLGTETVALPSDEAKITENGTWAFFGNGSGTGILKPIENLSFNKVAAEGNGIVKTFEAKEFILLPAASDSSGNTGISLTAGETSSETVTISSPVTLSTKATFVTSGEKLEFGDAITDSESDSSSSTNLLTLSCDTTTDSYDAVAFTGIVSSHIKFIGNADFSASGSDSDFAQDSAYNFTVGTASSEVGAVKFGTKEVMLGKLIVNEGSSFTQTGENTASSTHSASSIENNGTVIWDAGDDGGYLTLGGSVTGSNAAETVFNKKNVSVSADATLSGVFYDLAIENGVTVTNGSGITVRNNFTVDGDYTANGQTLRLGEITVASDTLFANGTEGKISGSGSDLNLGDVVFMQAGQKKEVDFTNAVTFESLSLDSASTGTLYFGGKVILNSDVSFTSPILLLYSEIPGRTGEYGAEFEAASGKTLTYESAIETNPSATGICSLVVNGNAVFKENVTLDGRICFEGSLTADKSDAGELTIHSDSCILARGSANQEWKAGVGTLLLDGDVFVALDGGNSLSVDGGTVSFAKNLFCLLGELASGDSNALSVAEDFALFGSAYNADDPRYSGNDTRFAYFGSDSFAYDFDLSGASASLGSGTSLSVAKNLYVNGANLSSCTFTVSENSASHPVYNSTDSATQTQWGVPYAVVFNSSISNSSIVNADSTGSAFAAASTQAQGCTDSGGNTNFQFDIPEIVEAYSISDAVIQLSFSMDLENSNDEAKTNLALLSYNGGTLSFDGKLYTDSDCTAEVGSNTDIPAKDALGAYIAYYLKSPATWNTDASYSSSGNSDSTDRSGVHQSAKIDVTVFEGLFSAADGKTMGANYGSGLSKNTSGSYEEASAFKTLDKARPVLISVYTGQEAHVTPNGSASASDYSADSQKPYDAHNFIEFRYSEPVSIGDLAFDETSDSALLNISAQASFDSSSSHGGALVNESGGLSVTGFGSFSNGSISAGYKSGSAPSFTGTSDTARPHALYRKFSLTSGGAESMYPCRIRISVAGKIDGTVSMNGDSFYNWIGYIDSVECPTGTFAVAENANITDAEGNALEHRVNASMSVQTSSGGTAEFYGSWDVLPPVFATYVSNTDGSEPVLSWDNGDSAIRQYEIVGTVDSNTNAYIDKIEMHLFDNKQNYLSSDSYKWISKKGWFLNGSASVLPGSEYSAPESAGGSRAFVSDASRTVGGIRRSSLLGASSAFRYTYSLDSYNSGEREFDSGIISQHVKSSLFRRDELSETFTNDDGVYIGISLNSADSNLPIRTVFTVTYLPDESFVTDLAGNRLLQRDSGSEKKILHSVDITPPSFTMTLSPIGEDKLYAVFTKPLAYKGTYLHELGGELDSVLDKICKNVEFVYSTSDAVDTTDIPTGADAISVLSARLVTRTNDYTALLFTLDRKISLSDVESLWLRINEEGEPVETIFGTIKASYIQDRFGNSVPVHTCHALSDFAINAVNMLYAYADSSDDEWNEHEIYGTGVAPRASDYAVHDFSADGGNYSRLRAGRDIVFQFEFIGGEDSNGKYAPQNGETLSLVYDMKSNIKDSWKSDKFNLLTGSDWRIWLDRSLESLASAFNDSALSTKLPGDAPKIEAVENSDILKNMTFEKEAFNLSVGNEYQLFFKILDPEEKTGLPLDTDKAITINHDGDKTTARIPLYAFRMPEERIKAGDFSFIDLWSFLVSDITQQRGGVTILNNVINAGIGEKTVIEVDMKSEGNLNVFVMTLDGNIIKRLSKGTVSAGTHYYYWDGKNNAGNPVARGLYFVRVSGSGIDETRKVMVVK